MFSYKFKIKQDYFTGNNDEHIIVVKIGDTIHSVNVSVNGSQVNVSNVIVMSSHSTSLVGLKVFMGLMRSKISSFIDPVWFFSALNYTAHDDYLYIKVKFTRRFTYIVDRFSFDLTDIIRPGARFLDHYRCNSRKYSVLPTVTMCSTKLIFSFGLLSSD